MRREKNFIKLLVNVLWCAALPLFEIGFYALFDTHAFVRSVFQFSALGYASVFGVPTANGTVNIVYVCLIMLVAAAYFTHPKDAYAELGYACFYGSGVTFVLFGLMSWHPQWLLFAVPFWTLAALINRRWDLFLLVDCAAAIIFDIYAARAFYHQTDETLFRYGVLTGRLKYNLFSDFSVGDMFSFFDLSLLMTLLSATFLFFFIFSHPRFNGETADAPLPRAHRWLTARFACGVLAFVIPACICLPSFLKADVYLYAAFDHADSGVTLTVSGDDADFRQQFVLEGGTSVTALRLIVERVPAAESAEGEENRRAYEEREHSLARMRELYHEASEEMTEEEIEEYEAERNRFNGLTVTIYRASDGVALGSTTVYDNDIIKDDYTLFEFDEPVAVEPGVVYEIGVRAVRPGTLRVLCSPLSLPDWTYYDVLTKNYDRSVLIYRGESAPAASMVVDIYGRT